MRTSIASLTLGALAALAGLGCRQPTGLDEVVVTVAPERVVIRQGEGVRVRVAATNRSGEAVAFSGSSTRTLWVEVLDAAGRPVARLAGGTDDLVTWRVAPADSAVSVQTWNGRTGPAPEAPPVAAGVYRVVGWLEAAEVRRRSRPVPITVNPSGP